MMKIGLTVTASLVLGLSTMPTPFWTTSDTVPPPSNL